MDEEFNSMTAVRIFLGLLKYTRLPQGLKKIPAVFRRVVNKSLGNFKEISVWSFMYDGFIGSKNEEAPIKDV